jgi:hypothetical protein
MVVAEAWGAEPRSQPSEKVTPFYCDRSALTAEQRVRQRELGKVLRATVTRSREVRDGYEFEFPGNVETYRTLTEYIPLERACCPFFEFNIRLEREGGPLYWRLIGREGVKDFIREELKWLLEQ